MGWDCVSLPWRECNLQSEEKHRWIEDDNGLVIGGTNYISAKMDQEHRTLIIKSVNNFPAMLEALKKVAEATAVTEGDMTAVAMPADDLRFIVNTYLEAYRETHTSQD